MGMLGRYIDALPDEARDRIIRGQNWHPTASGRVVDLVDRVEQIGGSGDGVAAVLRQVRGWWRRMPLGFRSRRRLRIRFLRARERLGPERLVRVIKLRAGKPNRPPEGAAAWRRGNTHPEGR